MVRFLWDFESQFVELYYHRHGKVVELAGKIIIGS